MRSLIPRAAALCAAAAVAAGCGSAPSPSGPAPARTGPPPVMSPGGGSLAGVRPAHTVIVVMENHSYGQVIGNPGAPFINSLAAHGALFTNAHAATHPSEPNYLAMFSGSTQGIADDSCPHRFTAANLGSELIAAHRSFAGYSEGLPQTGSYTCGTGGYARKHVPWINFSNVPASASKPFTAFPADYTRLPTVSFVIPDLCHDMHDCAVATGDAWLRAHLAGYASWARTHHSLLIVTWDENDDSPGNHIPLILAGQQVRPGRYGMPVTHYGLLHTVESLYRLPATGQAASAPVITASWR